MPLKKNRKLARETDSNQERNMAESTKSEDLSERFARHFNNSKYSDVTIYLGEAEFKLPGHRMVLGAASSYFDRAFETNFKENQDREFHFREYSTHALWRVFQYMYESDYSEETPAELNGLNPGDDQELLKHPRVFAIADMFQMDELKDLAVKKFKTQLSEHWISDTFPDCIHEVYDSTYGNSNEMKEVVVAAAEKNIEVLSQRAAFNEVVRTVGDFGVDLIRLLTSNPSKPRQNMRCRQCGSTMHFN